MLFMRGPMLEKPCLTKPWSNGSQVWEYTRTSQNPLNQFGMCCPWEVPFWRNLEAMADMFESLQDPKSHSNSSVCVVCERSFWRHLDTATSQIKLQEAQDPWNIGEVLKFIMFLDHMSLIKCLHGAPILSLVARLHSCIGHSQLTHWMYCFRHLVPCFTLEWGTCLTPL